MKIFFLLLLVLSGCAKLNPDPSLPAIESNYPSAEGYVRGDLFNGLKIVWIRKGDPLENLLAKIQTYYEGTVKIDSKNCGIEVTRSYENSELIPIPLKGPAKENCVVTFTVSPRYPAQDHSIEVVHGFRGHLAIRVLNHGEYWTGAEAKVAGSFSKKQRVYVGGDGMAQGVFEGCGKSVSLQLPLDSGFATVELADVVAPGVKTCVVEGSIANNSKASLVSFFVAVYDQRFVPLAIPVSHFDGNELCLQSEKSVAITSIGSSFDFSESHCAKIDRYKETIRLLSVKGRSVFGTAYPNMKEIVWKQ